MSRIAYVDGAYRAMSSPLIGVEDRGFQLADGVYEVWGVRAGALMDVEGHLARLERSLGELRIPWRMSRPALLFILRETARRNRVRDGLLYLQVSRGEAPRDHPFPDPPVTPTLVVTARAVDPKFALARAEKGVGVITMPEMRWARCDIKSTSLLPNVLAKQAAREAGAFEAWFLDDDGLVIEGASSNAWIVDAEGRLRTRALSNALLAGVTRAAMMRIAADHQIVVEERAFTVAEAKAAREAFNTSATNVAIPVVRIDGAAVGDGRPGPIARLLREAYFAS